MSGSVEKASAEFQQAAATLSGKLDTIANMNDTFSKAREVFATTSERLNNISDQLLTTMRNIVAEQNKLRALLLGKMDGLQGTIDLVRVDLRSNWTTADFAISNSRHVREEAEKMMSMVSALQKQQQILSAQVDELRKDALDKRQSDT